jgi:tripartite-type tricarboxylate transporter receptor subunit TctC
MGVLAPKNTPPVIVERLNKAINKVLAMPAVRSAFDERGVTVVRTTPQQFGDFIGSEIKRWTAVVKASGIQVD